MKKFLFLGLAFIQLSFFNLGVSAQETSNTGSLQVNLTLPNYTLDPTPISRYSTLMSKYLVLTSVTVVPFADSAIFGVKIKNAKGTKASAFIVEYGRDAISEHKVSNRDGVTEKTAGGGLVVKELQPNTEYRFRLSAFIGAPYSEGSTVVTSPEYRFTTPASGSAKKISFSLQSPRIKLKTLGIGNSSAKVVLQTNTPTTARIDYAEFKPYFVYSEKKEDATLSKSHTLIITGLKPNTVYPYKVSARDASGAETSYEFVLKTKAKK